MNRLPPLPSQHPFLQGRKDRIINGSTELDGTGFGRGAGSEKMQRRASRSGPAERSRAATRADGSKQAEISAIKDPPLEGKLTCLDE